MARAGRRGGRIAGPAAVPARKPDRTAGSGALDRRGTASVSHVAGTERRRITLSSVKWPRWLPALCLSAVALACAGCQTLTEYVVPHPRHAEGTVHEQVTEVLGGLARTERDLKKLLTGQGLADRGRLFLHVSGSGIGSELSMLLHQEMSHILEDAGYEIVSRRELEKNIRRHVSGEVLSCDRRVALAAARALQAHDGVGALDICVTSVSSLGLGELNNEGEYEERLRMSVTATLLEAGWGSELFRDRATLTSRTVLRQAERHYIEKARRMSVRERSMYRLLLDHVRILLPRFPERRR